MTTLSVGAGQTYSTIAAAVNAAADGDTVLVQAGTYVNDFVTVRHNITMKSVGGLVTMQATDSPPNGKAIVTADASLTIDGFGFTGAAVSDNNGAGIRWEAGDLTVRNSVFWNNQDGILGGVDGGHAIIQNSEFSHNGAGDGASHNIYTGNVASLLIDGSYFHDSVVGHEIKSRAQNTVITNSRIFDNTGDGSYSIDLPQGGNATITNNVIEKGPNAANWISIHFGGEVEPYASSSLVVSGNTLINDNANGYLITNSLDYAPVTLSGNQIWGYQASHISLGSVTVSNNTTLATRPNLDLSSIAPAIQPPVPPPIVVETPVAATVYVDFGRQGAVTASGHILTVGAGRQFGSLATALLASQDGDTIQVAAGTYTNDFGVINHKVIIEGVGGIARFTQKQDLTDVPSAILTVAADATIRNVEITGADLTGRESGLRVTAGHVTLVNDLIDTNDIGIWADNNPNTTLSIYDSEIGSNGNVSKGTNNLQINQIGSFTLRNSYVHGAVSGHEIFDLAFNTVIQDSRIIDGAGAAASFLIDLGQGGKALIQNNVLNKSKDTANGVLIHVGGEGPMYDNSDVDIVNNTLATELTWANGHPYTYFIVADSSKGSIPLTVDGNRFVGGVNGSVQVTNGTATNSTTATSVLLDTSSPVRAAAAPAPAVLRTGPNVLQVKLTETAGQIDGQFIVSVDGNDVGGGWVTARDGIDAPQTFAFNGWWGAGPHVVTVRATDVSRIAPTAYSVVVKSVALDNSRAVTNTSLVPTSLSWSTTLSGKDVFDPTGVVGAARDYLGLGSFGHVVRWPDGSLTIWYPASTDNVNVTLAQRLTANGTAFKIDDTTTILGGGQDYMGIDGHTLFLRDASGTVSARSFDAAGAANGPTLRFADAGVSFHPGSDASIIGAGPDYFGNGTKTLFVRDGSGALTAWAALPDGRVIAVQSLANGAPITADGDTMILGAGGSFFGAGQRSVFVRDGSGAMHVWGFDSAAHRTAVTDLTFLNTPLVMDSTGSIVGAGSDYFDNGGKTIFLEGGDGWLHGWSFNSNGALNAGIDFTRAGNPLIAKGALVFGAVTDFFGNGEKALFVRSSDGQLHAWGANATGAIDVTMDFRFSTAPVVVDTGGSISGGGQDFFGNGGRTVFIRGGDGWLHGWGFDSNGVINAGIDFVGPGTNFVIDASATIVGAGQDYFGNGERALFMRAQDGGLSVASFRNDASLDIRQAFTLNGTTSVTLDPGAKITGVVDSQSPSQGASHGIYVQDNSGATHVWTFDANGVRTAAA